MNKSPILSIDIHAEIEKITEKQHLNDVHYGVQMIRHALRHQPTGIWVERSRSRFVIEQNGRVMDEGELRAMRHILRAEKPKQMHQALDQLESHYGVALLSLCLEHPGLAINTGHWALGVVNQEWVLVQGEEYHQGYRILVPRKRKENDIREIHFFCKHCDVPLFLNGEQINQPIFPETQLLTYKVTSKSGLGFASISPESRLNETLYFKQGIRVGIKKDKPQHGLVVHRIWNGFSSSFERDYQETIQLGRRYLPKAQESLLEGLANGFFQSDQKEAFKKYLLALDIQDWEQRFGLIPLFAGEDGPFSYSVHQLRQLDRKYGHVPFLRKLERGRDFPVLTRNDCIFIKKRLGLEVKSLCHVRTKRRWLTGLWRRWRGE